MGTPRQLRENPGFLVGKEQALDRLLLGKEMVRINWEWILLSYA